MQLISLQEAAQTLGPVSQSLLRKAIADGRLRRGMSQSDLAEQTWIKDYRLSLIDCGRVEPSEEERRLLSFAFGLTEETLEHSSDR